MISKRPYRAALPTAVAIMLALPFLASCAGQDEKTSATKAGSDASSPGSNGYDGHRLPGDPGSIERARKIENMIVGCMKKNGFTYVAYVDPALLVKPPKEATDYASLKKKREKNGFGVFFGDAFPNDPSLRGDGAKDTDPNKQIRNKLDKSQLDAYKVALYGKQSREKEPDRISHDGCYGEAEKAVSPNERRLRDEKIVRQNEESAKGAYTSLDPPALANNPELKQLEATYRTCLKGKGYDVTPTVHFGVKRIVEQTVLEAHSNITGGDFGFEMDSSVAQQGFKDEIKAALEDLECGKDYLALHGKLFEDHRRQIGEIP